MASLPVCRGGHRVTPGPGGRRRRVSHRSYREHPHRGSGTTSSDHAGRSSCRGGAGSGAAAAADFTWCAGQGAGEPVTEDTTDPGLSAIWRFEKAFYYDRDPVAARAVGAPEAVMASAERLRIGIDALEPAVEFCVLADPVSSGVYDVTVVERGPGIDPRTSSQRFTTAESGGTTSITAITRR